MKEKLKNSPWLQRWLDTRSPLVISLSALREMGACLGYLLGGFLLSAGTLVGQPSPFALGLLAATGGGLRGLGCLMGTAVGYLTMQPFAEGLQLTSSAILIYVCGFVFASLWVSRQRWFPCLVSGLMTGIVGLIFLLSQPLTPGLVTDFVLLVLLAAASPVGYDRLLREKRRCGGSLLAAVSFLLGAAAISLPLGACLGCVLGVAAGCNGARRADLGTGAAVCLACGAALDLALGTGGLWCLTLGLGGLLGGAVDREKPVLRTVGFLLGWGAAGLGTGALTLSNLLTLGLGLGASFLLPDHLIAGREQSAVEASAALVEERLRCFSRVLEVLWEALCLEPEGEDPGCVVDHMAAKVCRRCAGYSRCWEKEAKETAGMFEKMLPELLHRGGALREDFPEEFDCRHVEGLVVALNQELEARTARAQSHSRSREMRAVAGRYIKYTGELLEKSVQWLRRNPSEARESYSARLGVAAKGRRGGKISGDRGLSLHTEDGILYVLLSDGMGTGALAAEESVLAVEALGDLLRAGMEPEKAMELINGMYLLRDSGGFATMDLLELSLLTGQGMLYKWGAAPSFLRSGDTVRALGEASPPPGLGPGLGAEKLRVNLWDGDILVMVSDGIPGAGTEQLIRDFSGDNVKGLANRLVEAAERRGGEDDMTAAVVQLRELALS